MGENIPDAMPEHLAYIQDLLVNLLETPSPTGDTGEIMERLEAEAAELGFQVEEAAKVRFSLRCPGRTASGADC